MKPKLIRSASIIHGIGYEKTKRGMRELPVPFSQQLETLKRSMEDHLDDAGCLINSVTVTFNAPPKVLREAINHYLATL